jgi:hypothetical protein
MEKEENAKTEEETSEETGKIQVVFSIFPFYELIKLYENVAF